MKADRIGTILVGLFVITVLALVLLSFIRPETSNMVQTVITALTAFTILVPMLTLRRDLKQLWAKPDFLAYVEKGVVTRAYAESLSNETFWPVSVRGHRKFSYNPNDGSATGFMLILRNVGTGTLHAPVIRLVPEASPASGNLTIGPHKGTGFEREVEGYTLYNPVGHIMAHDTVIYGFQFVTSTHNSSTTVKYRLSVRGADQPEAWIFEFDLDLAIGS